MKPLWIVLALLMPVSAASAQGGDIDTLAVKHERALQRGTPEMQVEAARALGNAITRQPARADASLRAYAAGQTLCIYAACEGAAGLATFAAQRHMPDGGFLTDADIALLGAYAVWITEPPSAGVREKLDRALENARDLRPTPLSVVAFQQRYSADANAGDWQTAAQTASDAAEHFAPHRLVIGERWSDAVMLSATASFNNAPTPKSLVLVTQHAADLVALDGLLDTRPDWLAEQFYTAIAWNSAMSAYFQSGASRRGYGNEWTMSGPDPEALEGKTAEILGEATSAGLLSYPAAPDGDARLPFCKGKLNETPEFRYPRSAARRGMFGSVFMKLSIRNMEVSEVEILAAVPAEVFESEVEKTVGKWKWVVEDGTPGETCRTSADNVYQRFLFLLH